MTGVCCICGAAHSRWRSREKKRYASYCQACHARHMRETRKPYRDLSPLEKRKDNARSHANLTKRRGRIKQENCCICGDENSEMHHEDYAEPLNVQWMCRKCHLDLHYGEIEQETRQIAMFLYDKTLINPQTRNA